MQLKVGDESQDFIPVKTFRAEHHLPDDFGVALFEPKDYTDLGRIDRAGAELNTVRDSVLQAIPPALPRREWLNIVPEMARLFQNKLVEINDRVGLKEVEIDFAVAGFSDVCQAVAYALLRPGVDAAPPNFQQVYHEWLNNSVRIFAEVYPYQHQQQTWNVQIIAHAYGRVGLLIAAETRRFYVHDSALACPAEGFMAALLGEVAARMIAAST